MKTAFQYIRKSNEDQSNFSISGQQLINEEWARKNNIQIIGTYIDDGYSAKDFNRPDWKRLALDLPKSKVDYLIIMKYDRLIRNVIEGLTFVEKLEQKWNITLLSVMENYSIDIHDPYFFKHRADMFVDADFERRRISDRSRFGIWSAKTQGRFLGRAPFGYINKRDSEDKPIIVVNPEESKIIKVIFDLYLSDVSPVIIMIKAKQLGFKYTGKDALRRILTNKVYAGLIEAKAYKAEGKKTVRGLHEPIVTEDVFWSAFYKLQEKSKPVALKLLDENLPLRGFLKCQHCDSPHTGAKCKGKLKYYHYYWCNTCRGKNFSAKKVHSDIATILNGLSLSEKHIEALKALSEIELNETIKERSGNLEKVNRDYSVLQKKIHSLEEKYLSNKIADETYTKWHDSYSFELNKLKISISQLSRDEKIISKLYNDNLEYLTDLNYLYNTASIEDKQSYLKALFPGCLTTTNEGYRTPSINKLVSANSLSLVPLLQIESERGLPFSEKSPIRVRTGARTLGQNLS